MFSKILVATDGSGSATRAVNLGAKIAKAAGATLYAISVYAPGEASNPLAGARMSGVDAAKGLLEDVVKHHGGDIDIETEALPGDPADVIVSEAKRHGIDLIIVGDRGMTGAKHVIGSVPNTISHQAPCHVLLAHTADEKVDDIQIGKVLLATDGSDTATKAVETGANLADLLGIKSILITVGNEKEGNEALAATEKALDRVFDKRVVQGSVADAIIDTAQAEGVDLIVTGSKGMQGARRLLGSVPNSVSHHLVCSMLIAKTV